MLSTCHSCIMKGQMHCTLLKRARVYVWQIINRRFPKPRLYGISPHRHFDWAGLTTCMHHIIQLAIIEASLSEPYIDRDNSQHMYVCMYVCMYVSNIFTCVCCTLFSEICVLPEMFRVFPSILTCSRA